MTLLLLLLVAIEQFAYGLSDQGCVSSMLINTVDSDHCNAAFESIANVAGAYELTQLQQDDAVTTVHLPFFLNWLGGVRTVTKIHVTSNGVIYIPTLNETSEVRPPHACCEPWPIRPPHPNDQLEETLPRIAIASRDQNPPLGHRIYALVSTNFITISVEANSEDLQFVSAHGIRFYHYNAQWTLHASGRMDFHYSEYFGEPLSTVYGFEDDTVQYCAGDPFAYSMEVGNGTCGSVVFHSEGGPCSTNIDNSLCPAGSHYNSESLESLCCQSLGAIQIKDMCSQDCCQVTCAPTMSPSLFPTANPTFLPTLLPTQTPTVSPPTNTPTGSPSGTPSDTPTTSPTSYPTAIPTMEPTVLPSYSPTISDPTAAPSRAPTTLRGRRPVQFCHGERDYPGCDELSGVNCTNPTVQLFCPALCALCPDTVSPTTSPTTSVPSMSPTFLPTTASPTASPTIPPTSSTPTTFPTKFPTSSIPTSSPSGVPTQSYPTMFPTLVPTISSPSVSPTMLPTANEPTSSPTSSEPTHYPTHSPTVSPTVAPTISPTVSPTWSPTMMPTQTPTRSCNGVPDNVTICANVHPVQCSLNNGEATVFAFLCPALCQNPLCATTSPTTSEPTQRPTISPLENVVCSETQYNVNGVCYECAYSTCPEGTRRMGSCGYSRTPAELESSTCTDTQGSSSLCLNVQERGFCHESAGELFNNIASFQDGLCLGSCHRCDGLNGFQCFANTCEEKVNNCRFCELNRCTKCQNSHYLLDGVCLKTCPAGYTSKGTGRFSRKCICKEFENNCRVCNTTTQACTKCMNQHYLLNETCVERCPNDYNEVGSGNFNRRCVWKSRCNAGFDDCHVCSWGYNNMCTKCRNGKYLHRGVCLDDCPDGFEERGQGNYNRYCRISN